MSLILKTLPNEKRKGKLIGHKPINTICVKIGPLYNNLLRSKHFQFNKSISSEAAR